MIRLYTGLPGAGKSLSLVDALRRMHEAEPGRPVFAYGIDGLREDLAQACEPFDWEDLPDGSIVVVDEAQKVWPSRRSGEPHAKVRAFSEHRHRGFDFLLATQSPAYLDPYLRGLVQQHTHVVRRWGSTKVTRYVWEELCEDVKSVSMRGRAQRDAWKYPRECFDLYKSSSLHTVKRTIPKQFYLIGAAVVLVPLLGWAGWHQITRLGSNPALAAGGPSAADGGASSGLSPKRAGGSLANVYGTVDEYVKAHIPRVASQPWSAPVYDQQAVVSRPELLCVEYEDPRVPGQVLCRCYTEQVTPYRLGAVDECREYARHGVYNPRRALASAVQGGQAPAAAESPQGAAAMGGFSRSGGWPRGGIPQAYVPPEMTTAGKSGRSSVGLSGGG